MNKIKLLAASVSVLMSACTTTPTVPTHMTTSDDVLHVEHAQLCSPYQMRDLSVIWPSRTYWCDTSIIKNSDQNAVNVNQLTLTSIKRARQTLLLSQNYQTQTVSPTYIPVSTEHDIASLPITLPVRDDDENHTIPSISLPPVDMISLSGEEAIGRQTTHHIPFATGRETLGPQGRRLAQQLIPRIKKAQHVTLRGQLLNNEFVREDALTDERRSVGRALSIRTLWQEAGIQSDAVTILHYTPDTQGPYVEVLIRD